LRRVDGPFTGTRQRFVLDRLMLPTATTGPGSYGPDFDGDGNGVNHLRSVISGFGFFGDVTPLVDGIVAAGGVDATVDITSDDPGLREDETVAVSWNGTAEGSGTVLGAWLRGGRLVSNEVVSAPALETPATLAVPLAIGVSPTRLPLDHYELTLVPDGKGGFDGELRGTTPQSALTPILYDVFTRVIALHPGQQSVIKAYDKNRDGRIDASEFASNAFTQTFSTGNTRINGVQELSVAVGFHLSPCAGDKCARPTPPAARCDDGVRNGDEADVDCGGKSCDRCVGSDLCGGDDDCQSGHCDAGHCRAPSCDDGIKDGFEIDVDCGEGCGKCATGKTCDNNEDCASASCTFPADDTPSTGVCG
jgi:hypothetical protein